ncbi:NAD(P)/FAD-dependent oxidoreductase [Prauserella cavernicola]|uniref:FAD-binding oxidoreductase n=1 Tax=Prauserella cavernicola TaxID=2800127 RepID=A0A934V3H3_9PSEU|nr:FAD-binding oxidoreductase [Prauserella cavernicola]MBK1787286.1 FAD-binding oxidoreductase [Prauserella cavernicola]
MNADVVVVGAGVIGSSIALELARAGRSVVVVDKGAGPGHGSTSASSAVVRFNFSTWDGVATSWESKFCWENWRDHLEAPDDLALARYHRTGLALLDVDVAPRERSLPLFDRAGVPYEEWDPATLAARVPGIDTGRYWPPARIDDDRFWAGPDGDLGAVFTPDAGYVDDPRLAADNLAAAARRLGVTFLHRQTVAEVVRTGGRAAGVRTAGGRTISADVVVNAAGPWSGGLNRLADVGGDFTVGVRPLRQEVHYVPTNPRPFVSMAIADMDLGTYLRPETGGVLVGGTEPECEPLEWLENPEEAGELPKAALFEAQVTRAARRLPELGVPSRPKGVVGVYDVSDDWTPIYDRTELPGFYVAIGTSGNQFKNAPVVGQLLTAIIDGTEAGADHDAHPIQFVGKHSGLTIDLGSFSRKRPVNEHSTGTVFG